MEFNKVLQLLYEKYSYSIGKIIQNYILEKVELLVKRMRWKAPLCENSNIRQSNPLHHIFKSRKAPPHHKDLIAFENDLVKLMQNVTLKCISNNFRDQMKADIESIKRSKTNNL